MRLLLTLTTILVFNLVAEAKIIKAASFAEAIEISNTLSGKDSLYLSDFNWNLSAEAPKQYDITDQLVLINDLGENADLLRKEVIFKVAITGSLQLIDFDMTEFNSKFVNLGKISLDNCRFTEGKDLTNQIRNKGLFTIRNGVFHGHKDGLIIRDADFKVGAAVIL